jgi:uncharacterized membrane protein
MTYFTFLSLLYSAIALFTGIRNKYFPPKQYSWYGGVQIKEAKVSEDSWQEANRFTVTPLLIIGIVFLLFALLPLFFSQVIVLSFTSAIMLILASSVILVVSTKKHLKQLFDEQGNRKRNA